MAENKSSAQHLASLDVDVSGILESLKKVDEDVREYGLSMGKNFQSYFGEGVSQGGSDGRVTASDIIDTESFDKAKESAENLGEGLGSLTQTVQKLNDAGELIGQKLTFVNDDDVKTVVNYNSELEKTVTITKNITDAKKEQLELEQAWEKQLRSTATETEKYSTQGLEKVNADLAALNEKQSQYEKQVESSTKQEEAWYERQVKAKENAISQIDKFIAKQQQLSQSISSQPSYLVDQDLLSTLEATISKFSQLRDEFEDSTIISPQQQVALSNYVEDFKGLVEEIERYLSTVNQYDQITSQLESLVDKQKDFNDLVSKQKTSTVNRNIIKENDELIKSAQELIQNIAQQNISVEDAREQFENLKKKAEELSETYDKAGSKGESFLEKISDKAKWLGAFYVVNELKNGFFETINIIKETEDAVVDLQRVLNDDSISQSKMSSELYDIAYEYGRTFEEVAEVSTQFAQAGYDWADTMELTRGTMLALNTAELDVTQSTEGLIAILAQWNLTAEDYADVIDKINITADNFAVTSETIVAALQRSSSSAKNANFTLEETISIITSLAEATGRSGENIGTALNSLIVYTSKTNALKTFAEVGSDAMKQIVADYQAGAASIFDVWKQLSEEVQNLSQQQQEALFNSDDFQELATELQSAIGDVYGSAGTYRQNTFIALLNNIETVRKAMENMAGYAGYSAKENEKYMESLTASWNQLKAALAELAVQLGDAGLLDLLKFLTDAATASVKLAQSLGGVVPLLTTIIGLALAVKQQKINASIAEVVGAVSELKVNVSDFISTVSAAPGVVGKLNAALTALSGAGLSVTGVIGLISVALGAVMAAYNAVTNSIEETNQAFLESAKTNLDSANSLEQIKQKYIEIMDTVSDEAEREEQLSGIKDTLIKQYGLEKTALDELNESRDRGIALIEEETRKTISDAYSDAASQYKKAREEMEKTYGGFDVSAGVMGLDDNVLNTLREYGVILKSTQSTGALGSLEYSFDVSGDNLKEQLETLKNANAALQAQGIIIPELEDKIADLNERLQENADAYETGTEATAKYFVYADERFAELRDNVSDIDSFIEYRQALVAAAEGNSDLIQTMDILLSQEFPEFMSKSSDSEDSANDFALSIDSLTEGIETLSENIQTLSDDLNSFQSAYATVTAALEEYNENGVMSLNTIQSIINLGPEYISMLETVDGKLRLNEEALEILINAQRENVVQMLQQGLAADTLELANEYLKEATEETAEAQADATEDSDDLETSLSNLAGAYLEAGVGALAYGEAVAGAIGDDKLGDEFKQRANELYDVYKNLYDQVINIGSDRDYWTGASSAVEKTASAAKSAEDEIDNLIDKLNDLRRQREEAAVSLTSEKAIQDNQTLLNQIYALISGLQDGTVSADAATEALEGFDDVVSQIKIEESTYKKLVDEQETLAKDQLELQDMVLQRQKERLEAEKEAIEERYDYEEERVDELSESLEEIQSLMDYSRSRQSLLREISNAESRVGVEYREAERDAREELQQLEEDRILTSVEAFLDKVTENSNKEREKQINKLDEDIKAIDDQLDDLADIKSLLSNSIADLYNRFGGDLSDISEKVGNVDDFLSSIGYIVQTDESALANQDMQSQGIAAAQNLDVESAVYDIAKTSLSSISDMIYEGLDLQDSASQEMFTSMSAIFIQSASTAISVAISQGMSSMSAIIGASVASAIASGGSTTNSTTNYNTTNLVGNIASTAGTMTGQALWDFAMSYFTKP